MLENAETLETLWSYCQANRRCIPRDWHGFYQRLANARRLPSGGWEPALPLILGAWHTTSPLEKHLRFREHVEWAAEQGQLVEIGQYLRSLPEEQWFHFGEL